MNLGIVVASVIAELGTNEKPWGFVTLVVSTGLAAVVLYLVVGDRREKRRLRDIKDTLRSMGLRALVLGPEHTRPLIAALGPMGGLKDMPEFVVWAARGIVDGVDVVALELGFTDRTGKNSKTYKFAIVSIVVPEWPCLEIHTETLGEKIGNALGSEDIQVGDHAFNKRFHITSVHRPFALRFLSPEVQWFMAGWEPGIRLVSESKRLCLFQERYLDSEDWAVLINRAVGMRKALPPELDTWPD